MIQGGDPTTKNPKADGPRYTIPAEFRKSLFHKKGVIAAARNNNPEKASSGTQFYITQGKIFTDAGLDSLEKGKMFKDAGLNSLKNVTLEKKFPEEYRAAYKTIGGTPHLDFDYTVYGEVVKGIETVDKIAVVPTNRDRPVTDVRIIKATLIKRKKYKN